MSLLTGRKVSKSDPELPKKAETAKPGEVYVTKEKVDFGVNARRNMTDDKDKRMAASGYIPEVDEKGNRTGAYTVNRNRKPTREVETKPKPTPEPKGRPSQPVMQADQKKSTGQKQVGKTVWDNDKKQWKVVNP
jgi:hypothetical protein